MAMLFSPLKWLYKEFGLKSLQETGWDAWLIILSRSIRMLAYGAQSLILALFFAALEFSDAKIGLFMTLTLLGDVFLSLLLTLIADHVGRRRILFVGSLMMVWSGVVFARAENFWMLLFAAVVGVISATGGDHGPFRSIEESTLSHLTTPATRADILSWYITTSSVGSALGTELSGRLVGILQHREWSLTQAYHAVYWVYVGVGIFNMCITLLLSSKCEAKRPTETEESEILLNEMDGDDIAQATQQPRQSNKQSRFAQISRETRSVMYKLWFLLIVDSVADGMCGYSLTVYYIDVKFHPQKATLGDITSISYVLAACSTIFAAPLSRRLGLVNTMVFTHLPSSMAVLFFPLPQGIHLTVALLYLRTGLNNMDQAPRTALIAAMVKSEERTAVMGVTSMLRTLAETAGPTVTGFLAGNDQFWIAFVAAGILRVSYDLGLWAMFVNMKLYQHEDGQLVKEGRQNHSRHSADEEEPTELEELNAEDADGQDAEQQDSPLTPQDPRLLQTPIKHLRQRSPHR